MLDIITGYESVHNINLFAVKWIHSLRWKNYERETGAAVVICWFRFSESNISNIFN